MSIETMPVNQYRAAPRRSQWRSSLPVVAFTLVLAVGAALRLRQFRTSPAWQWDEAVYWQADVNVQHGMLGEHSHYGVPWESFLHQPRLYLLGADHWFDSVGASTYHARPSGIARAAGMQVLLFRLLWRPHSPKTALLAMIPVAFDGWLLYIERVSYIENAVMPIMMAAFVFYQLALTRPSWQRCAIGDLAVGPAAQGSYDSPYSYSYGSYAIWQRVRV